MSNVNNSKKAFLEVNSIEVGTIAWRLYITSLGFSAKGLTQDTKDMLISTGSWTGNMNDSLLVHFSDLSTLLTATTILTPTTEMSNFA